MSYTVKIDLNNQTYTASADGPVTGIPGLYVFFRTDEIVFHLGVSKDKTITPYNLGPHIVTVLNNGVQSAPPVYVPNHYWFTRWYFEINADTIIRSPSDIVSQKLSFPYGKFNSIQPANPGNTYTGPMSLAGMDPSMPDTVTGSVALPLGGALHAAWG